MVIEPSRHQTLRLSEGEAVLDADFRHGLDHGLNYGEFRTQRLALLRINTQSDMLDRAGASLG